MVCLIHNYLYDTFMHIVTDTLEALWIIQQITAFLYTTAASSAVL
jgi:hypothetical protein